MTRVVPLSIRHHAGQAGRAMIDQVLSSGAQLLVMVLVARRTDPTTFGAVSIALIVHGFLLGMMRASIGEPTLLRCRTNRAAAKRETDRGLFLALTAAAISAVCLLTAGAIIGGDVGSYLTLIALAAPLVYPQDLLRYVAYGCGRMDQAITIDGVWLGVQVVLSGFLLAAGEATPSRLIVAWIVGAGAGAAVGALRDGVWPRPVALGRWWNEERARASGFVSDYLVSNGMWQASFLVVGVVLSLQELAGLRVALVAVSPLGNLLAGVRTLMLANLAGLRSHPSQARQRAVQMAVVLATAATVYGIALVLLPDRWGAELFGATWPEAAVVVPLIAAAEALRLPTFAAIDLIKVLGGPVDLVRTRVMGSVGVVSGMMLGAILAGPRGAAFGTIVGYAWNQFIWWRRVSDVSRRPAAPAEPVSA